MTTYLEQKALDLSFTTDSREVIKKLASFGMAVMFDPSLQKEIFSMMTMSEEELIEKLDSIYTHQKFEKL